MLTDINIKLGGYFRTEVEVDHCGGSASSPLLSDGETVLNNGERMPVIGLGTAGFTDKQLVHQTILAALKAGYRMIGNDCILNTKTTALLITRHSRSLQ